MMKAAAKVGASIVIVYGVPGGAQRYRCLHLQEQLALCGIESHVQEYASLELPQSSADVIAVVHRVPSDANTARIVEQAHRRHGIVLFDTDDLVFDCSALASVRALTADDRVRTALYRDEVRRQRRTLESADAALVSNAFLAQQVKSLGKAAWVHRNGFSFQMLAVFEHSRVQCLHKEDQIIIGYASGTPTHDRDFQQAKPALTHILDRYPQSVLWIIGPLDAGDGWGRLRDRIRRIPFVPWQDLPSLLAQFDINIAPLEIDNPFCQAKSEVKYIEAGLVRVPTVASTTGAFEYAIRSGDNGFLAATDGDWVEALEQLVGDARLRREMGERAYADVLERYHPVVRGRELIGTLNQISRQVKGRPLWPDDLPCPDGDLVAERLWSLEAACQPSSPNRHRSLLDRALYALRYRGMRIFLMQAWVYLRSQLGPILSTCRPGRQRRHGSR